MKNSKKRFLSMALLFTYLLSSVMTFASGGDVSLPTAVATNETEPNNSIVTADIVLQDETIYGRISYATDKDYFKVVVPVAGYLNFWLGSIPNGTDYDLIVYNSDGVKVTESTGTGTQEHISGIEVSTGDIYYFCVVSASGYNTELQYKVRSKIYLEEYTGYSQTNPALSATNFSLTNLDKLYSNGMNTSWLSCFSTAGCMLASYAMILHNMGKKTTTSKYDFRTDTTGRLEADPFTVMMANTNWPSISASNNKYIANTTQDPVYVYHNRIASTFGMTANRLYFSGNDQNIAYTIAYYLVEHPEGVAVTFNSGSRYHTVVFTQTTLEVPATFTPTDTVSTLSTADVELFSTELEQQDYEEYVEKYESKMINTLANTYDEYFTVCDPATRGSNNDASPIAFGNSYASYSYGFSSAFSLIYLD